MTTPSIQDISAAAAHKLAMAGKTARQYKLLVWQQQTTDPERPLDGFATWHVEYQGKSNLQPYVSVCGITPEAVLKRFDEELQVFTPLSLTQIEELSRKKAQEA